MMESRSNPPMALYHHQMLEALAEQGNEEAIEISTEPVTDYYIPEHFNRKQRRAAIARLKQAAKKNKRRSLAS